VQKSLSLGVTMLKQLAAAAILSFFCTHAIAGPQPSASTPKLSGEYVYTWWAVCVPGDRSSNFRFSQITGVMSFDATTKQATLTGTQTWDVYGGGTPTTQPLAGIDSSFNGEYSNTSTTFTIAGRTFPATYGKVVDGIATYVSWVGIAPGLSGATCSQQATLSMR
jgi:hypothetical protein